MTAFLLDQSFTARIGEVIRRSDWISLAATALLLLIGLVAVWSFSPPGTQLFDRQLLWVGVGICVFTAFAFVDYRVFRNHGFFLMAMYLIVLLMLAALLVFAPDTRGVRGWFYIGSAGVQPVEVMKLVLTLVLAKYFSRRHVEIARPIHLLISGLYAGLALGLVILQPDLGSAMILVAMWASVVLFAGVRFRHFLIFVVFSAVVAAVAWFTFLAPYQKERITAFLDPYRDPYGAGYNTIQAMIAAGSGGFLGKGIGYGTQSQLAFLPEAETDFIFSAFVEETGLLGAAILLGLFGVLAWRMIRTGMAAADNFAKLYVLGFMAFFFAEVFIHLTINIGLLPVTGIGLPLISYGGSGMITALAGLGLVQSIRIHRAPW